MTTARRRQTRVQPEPKGADTHYRGDLWRMADALRGSMDANEYKHVVLGLIFLKYISDAFEEAYATLESERDQGADPEDPDEYRAQSIFWVPPEARWQHLKNQARQPTIGRLVDDAMTAVERDNPALRDVLPKEYGRDALDKQRLGQVVDLVSNIKVGGAEAQANDVLGQVYEYFLEQFAIAEGRKGGEFYTPRSVVRLLVEMLEPYQGRVYDPCCGSSGMFVQSVEFIRAHATGNGNGGRAKGDISIYGQESNYTTWRLAKMNLAIRGIEGQIAHGDSFHNDRHPDLRADYILANPPFNVSDWGGERLRDDKRWEYGAPPVGNANFAWVQHFLHHLAPRGTAGFVLATAPCPPTSRARARSARTSSRPAWWTASSRCRASCSGPPRYRPASGSCPRNAAAASAGTGRARPCSSTPASWGTCWTAPAGTCPPMTSPYRRHLPRLAQGEVPATMPTFRASARAPTLEEVRRHGHVLTPGRYVGAEPQPDDGEPFQEKMARLAAQWRDQQAEAAKLDTAIAENLERLGF